MPSPPYSKSYWLDDHILCGEYPRDKHESKEHVKLKAILGTGIRVFINLTEKKDGMLPYQEDAFEAATALGIDTNTIEFYHFPIVDLNLPNTRQEMLDILQQLSSSIEQNKSCYLHCWGGHGRTGTVAGCYLIEADNSTGDVAFAKLQELWQYNEKSIRGLSPETIPQQNYVKNWQRDGSLF